MVAYMCMGTPVAVLLYRIGKLSAKCHGSSDVIWVDICYTGVSRLIKEFGSIPPLFSLRLLLCSTPIPFPNWHPAEKPERLNFSEDLVM